MNLLKNILIIFLIVTNAVCAAGQFDESNLFPSEYDNLSFEINKIEIKGNRSFTDEDIFTVISSRETNKSFLHKLTENYYKNISAIKHAPEQLLKSLAKSLERMRSEIQFFDKIKVEGDVESIKIFYDKRGFHDVSVDYEFVPDSAERINKLIYIIDEGRLYKLSAIVYKGLDSLPEAITERINSKKIFKQNSKFNEDLISFEIESILHSLQTSGYYFASYEKPTVFYNEDDFADSVIVNFTPGERYRIGKITYNDFKKGYAPISRSAKEDQLEFKEGEFADKDKIRESENNLRRLGVFDIVKIETQPVNNNGPKLNIDIIVQYRKQIEYNGSIFFNQTTDYLYNGGIELFYLDRNALGKAQVFNPFVRFSFRDLNNIFSSGIWELGIQTGIKYFQPALWKIGGSSISLLTTPGYSYNRFQNLFDLREFNWPIKLFVKQKEFNVITDWSLTGFVQRQDPIKFQERIDEAFKNAVSESDTLKIKRALLTFSKLYEGSKDNFPTPTTYLLGVSAIGEHRDNILSPTSGYYLITNADYLVSIHTGYLKILTALNNYFSLNRNTVFATKIRIGAILPLDGIGYFPIDRQLFAGGANSVRGWAARKLRYTNLSREDAGGSDNYELLQDYVGNSSIIESSVELRYKLPHFRNMIKGMQQFLAGLVFAGFIDAGNSFGWFADDPPKKPTDVFKDFRFNRLAVAAGFGLRYELPFGPIRFDLGWPVYDPSPLSNKNKSAVFHIGLGHAF